MLDPKKLRNDRETVAQALSRRGFTLDLEKLSQFEASRRDVQGRTQELQTIRNQRSREIGKAKAEGRDVTPLLNEVGNLGEQLKEAEAELASLTRKINDYALEIPNMPDPSVPDGEGEEDNLEIRRWGTPQAYSFTPADHVELGSNLSQMDFEAGAKLSGARFVVLKSDLARLQRVLTQFMLDLHTQEHGYTEVYVPFLVNAESMQGTGQLPKFEEDLFAVNSDRKLYLIPTAEVPVTNLVRDMIIPEEDLPLKWVCHSPCFRAEAGAYGRDVRGMIRNHQFEKVELVQMVHPEKSAEVLEELTAHAETVLKKLQLPYRVVTLCTGDLGFSAKKTYDIEVWLPSQERYREISSCSNFGDFQARRIQARFRQGERKPELLHTLNGSGLAVGRTLLALIENGQQADGSILIPEVLQERFGAEVIRGV
jgi:seryl-tRNA synthetase